MRFPHQLHKLLEENKYENIISWQPHGRSFRIHNKEEFIEKVMRKHFDQSKLTSFHRQLNLYGFTRQLENGPDKGGYFHKDFLRGHPHLCDSMTRVGKGKRAKEKEEKLSGKCTTSAGPEPNFYKMKFLPGGKMKTPTEKADTSSPAATSEVTRNTTPDGNATNTPRRSVSTDYDSQASYDRSSSFHSHDKWHRRHQYYPKMLPSRHRYHGYDSPVPNGRFFEDSGLVVPLVTASYRHEKRNRYCTNSRDSHRDERHISHRNLPSLPSLESRDDNQKYRDQIPSLWRREDGRDVEARRIDKTTHWDPSSYERSRNYSDKYTEHKRYERRQVSFDYEACSFVEDDERDILLDEARDHINKNPIEWDHSLNLKEIFD